MTDEEAQVAALEFLRRVQTRDLSRTERWLADARRRLSEAERRRQLAARPVPDWRIETGIGDGPPASVHRGDCYLPGKRLRMKPVTRAQAVSFLDAGAEACRHCRPDTALGWLG
ncbi:DUF6233 domain-containing protein [Streptomyces tsukubensis]|uniref:Uncharacterized protein n=1 Tax=Streptomyces tsukubensis TaxID=83656 RepID=A0A1V4A939_9ACTN|nr:DUF6233 domain-containing protein [Streptomyces tsukubensis]OON78778.1 hypothetical protein B1H18_15505 [Streptomyces tsukubensis]QFR94256.1 hypothetical protein GBW32_15840 [Streptomyces tsukubensis]